MASAFISYGRENQAHEDWVRALAEDLVRAGVEVLLDQWDLRPGDDIAQFMDEGLDRAQYVLLVCTREYASKFDNRKGGVAHESDLMLGEMLTLPHRRGRLLPVLRSGAASTSIPRYLRSKLYIDFTNDDEYRSSLEQLVRRLFNAPKYVRPQLGSLPIDLHPLNKTDVRLVPRAWILVAGTGRPQEVSEQVHHTSEALGEALASNGFGLVTGGWPGVDEIVSHAFAKRAIVRGCALENFLTQVVVSDMPAFPAGNLVLVECGEEEWIEGVKRADGIVLIGGIGGTWTTGKYGLKYNKAVFPLADTDGDAKRFYLHMLRHWRDDFFSRIDRNRFQVVAREAPGVIKDLTAVLELI